jgi:hypothetical protein
MVVVCIDRAIIFIAFSITACRRNVRAIGLPDGFGLRGQAQEYLSEVAIFQYFSKLGVVRGAFFEAEQEVDFGAGRGHVWFDEE